VNRPENETVRVAALMGEVEESVRITLRRHLLAHGGAPDYEDPWIFAAVEKLLRRASAGRELDSLMLPELLGDDPEWRMQTHLRFSSHRPLLGPVIVFVKRRILLPLTRWLYEYTAGNFRRQQQLNRALMSCIEELAIENARLRRDLLRLRDQP
jgi:hypothetical protein